MAHSSGRASSIPSLLDMLRGGAKAPLPTRRCSKRASPSDEDSRSQDVSPHSCATTMSDDQECKRMRSHQDAAGCWTRSSARLPASRLAVATSAGSFTSTATVSTSQGMPPAPLLSCLSHDGRVSQHWAGANGSILTSASRRSSLSSECTAVLTPASNSSEEDAEMTSPAPQQQQSQQGGGEQWAQQPEEEFEEEDEEEEEDDVQSLLGHEGRFTPQRVFETQAGGSKLTPAMREMLVEWMCEVTIAFRLQVETFLLAVNYLDRYLSAVSVAKQQLQLLGAACLWIASKYEDVWPPSAQQMADMTEHTYTAREVVRMEAQVTHTLGWNLAVPCSSLKFLHAYVERAQVTSRRVLALSECLVQLAALDGATFVHAPASRVAATALSVALAAFGQTAGIPHVVKAAQWRDNEQLAHMSKELYARFTRMLAPGAPRNCIISQYVTRQRAIAATPAPGATPAAPAVAQPSPCAATAAAYPAAGAGRVQMPVAATCAAPGPFGGAPGPSRS